MSGVSSRRYPLVLRERATLNAGDQPPTETPYQKSAGISRRFMLSCAKLRGVAHITGAIGRVCGVDHGSDV
jgi:hypothetical protein